MLVTTEKLLKILETGNSLGTFNLENVNLLSNPNVNSQNGVAYKRTLKITHISDKEFETQNWLPVTERFNQHIQLFLSTLMINALII